MLKGCMNGIAFYHQVLIEEIRTIGVVGINTSHSRCCDKDIIGFVCLKPIVYILLLYQVDLAAGLNAQEIGTWLIYAAAFLTLWSMVYYLKAAIPQAIDYDQHS